MAKENLNAAVDMVVAGKKINEVSRGMDIPRTTLRNRLREMKAPDVLTVPSSPVNANYKRNT